MTAREDVRLRPAVPGDELAVARIHVRAWQVGYRGLLPDGYLGGLRAEDRAARYTFARTDPGRPQTIVAVRGDAVLGFATTGPAGGAGGAGELLALHVEPDRWRGGVGRALIAAARDRLVAGGFAEAVLWLLDGNERAARFYEADGWAFDGTDRTDEVWGITVRERRYRRVLTPPVE